MRVRFMKVSKSGIAIIIFLFSHDHGALINALIFYLDPSSNGEWGPVESMAGGGLNACCFPARPGPSHHVALP